MSGELWRELNEGGAAIDAHLDEIMAEYVPKAEFVAAIVRAEAAEADAARLAAALREAWTEDDDDARDALGLPLIWIRYQDALLAHDALVAERTA